MQRLFLLIVFWVFPFMLYSQNSDSLHLQLDCYASFRGQLAAYDNKLSMQENGSRIGFEISQKSKKTRYFIGAEIGINILSGTATFNASARTASGFIVLDQSQTNQLFAARTGYLGADFGKYGILKIGKQYGVYYDIAVFTDQFNVFGCAANNAYPAFSDGGAVGTGRANQSLTYRKKWGHLSIGLQGQFNERVENYWVDGMGLTVMGQCSRYFSLGAGVNKAYISKDILQHTIGLNGQPTYYILGASFKKNRWYSGLVLTHQTNGDLVQANINNETATVVFNAEGIEWIGKYTVKKITVLAGFNGLYPTTTQLPIYNKFTRQYVIAGTEYKPMANVFFYSEARLSLGKNQSGIRDADVFLIGLKIDVNRSFKKSISL